MSNPPAVNPRRRSARTGDAGVSDSLLDGFSNMTIRKGDTFHPQSNTSLSDFWDPLEARTTTPTALRSTTSPKSLEDLLTGAGERRVADLLERVDRAVALNSKHALSNVLSDPEVLPPPRLTVTEPSQDAPYRARSRHHSHSSDSGLGSSLADSTELDAKASPRTVTSTSSSDTIRDLTATSNEERGLSKYAAEQIHKHIVQPILREDSLKEFHELIESVPERIGDKEIKTLRDLEKTLIFLAPDYSRSPSKYLRFCERTIRVLHTTVTTLHESDQRAPADRPYTQGYFFDLVEQIRRYATILAVTREKEAKGDKLDAMDVQENEKLGLHGGMSHNGKQAVLVRHTPDGKTINVATGEHIPESELAAASSTKRSADLDMDEDEAFRSMARRKKNAKPEIHTCELCQKEFKRPCDLTKHVKTHERPWKCTILDCKYHEYGWPTEKERDRHVNDKHSSTPSLYHCLYKPCPYTSKRESNCKQHMEKAHGWNYVRSKSNGKGRLPDSTRLPQGSIPPSPASSHLTPLTPIAPSPSTHSYAASSRSGSMAPPSIAGSSSSNHITPFVQASPASDWAGHFNMNFDFNDTANYPTAGFGFPITPALSEERRASGTLSSHSDFGFDANSFEGFSPDEFAFDTFSDLNNFAGNYQPFTSEAGPSKAAGLMNGLPHVSPGAHIDQTFTSDAMNLDGAYDGHVAAGPDGDFTLFGGGMHAPASGSELFPSLHSPVSWGGMDTLGNGFDNIGLQGHPSSSASTTGTTNDHEVPALMPVSKSTLAELFPELEHQ